MTSPFEVGACELSQRLHGSQILSLLLVLCHLAQVSKSDHSNSDCLNIYSFILFCNKFNITEHGSSQMASNEAVSQDVVLLRRISWKTGQPRT